MPPDPLRSAAYAASRREVRGRWVSPPKNYPQRFSGSAPELSGCILKVFSPDVYTASFAWDVSYPLVVSLVETKKKKDQEDGKLRPVGTYTSQGPSEAERTLRWVLCGEPNTLGHTCMDTSA